MANLQSFLLPVLVFGALLFYMNRQQKKAREAQQNLQNSLQKGAHVVTIGGLHGIVDSINDANKTVTLDVEGVYLTFDAQAIRTVTDAPATVLPESKDEEA